MNYKKVVHKNQKHHERQEAKKQIEEEISKYFEAEQYEFGFMQNVRGEGVRDIRGFMGQG